MPVYTQFKESGGLSRIASAELARPFVEFPLRRVGAVRRLSVETGLSKEQARSEGRASPAPGQHWFGRIAGSAGGPIRRTMPDVKIGRGAAKLLEGLTIVVSILLAFTIDAGWDRYQEGARASLALTGLRGDFEVNRASMDALLDVHRARAAAFSWFRDASPETIRLEAPSP
jgi:hypothetical protein